MRRQPLILHCLPPYIYLIWICYLLIFHSILRNYLDLLQQLDQKYILEDLLFDYDSYKLTESVKNFLFLYAQWLKQNDEINIRIEGHTDSVGSDNYNMTLSENRAHEVLNFFVSEGILKNRMKAIGFGDKIPVAEGYDGPKNRRIEIKVF